ncbi:Cysteine protease [Citrifermentans bremense]|uniref:Cysteine protease n=1 Tax=Citrifermentans bremense TaxID=60035 RepID=A0A6S6M6H6_9BACT|nr:C1 family peptidase [Citrifermentans bremense]BCG49009.1 Cysteine protease [Citrifermentans bremense]
MGKAKLVTKDGRKLYVRPDTLDFRDRMFVPTLLEVPMRMGLEEYLRYEVPILDQGTEGACTGFGLATNVNYLLRKRRVIPDTVSVSPWMLYQLARRYDEWPGENYEGSSARGAIKGWHKHGVCATGLCEKGGRLTEEALKDAPKRSLGAYFRVNHKDLVAMHSALAEVGVLFATASVHSGWENVGSDGVIKKSDTIIGGHAFAIVGYDEDGFWIQNSWGRDWGKGGFARIGYDDWLANADDVWVARLGVPMNLHTPESTAIGSSAAVSHSGAYSSTELRRHIVSIGNNGVLRPGGSFGTSWHDVEEIFTRDFPALTAGWNRKRLLLYAHGGLVDEASAVQRVAEYRAQLLKAEIYPLAFIWHSDMSTTICNILQDAMGKRRSEGFIDDSKDFMLDRLDDALEPVARLAGKPLWSEMKQNALSAGTGEEGGARIVLEQIRKLPADVEIHLVGHSAGSIFHAPVVEGLAKMGRPIKSCTLWAPACTTELFKKSYLPSIDSGQIARFALFTLNDKAEQCDNCGRIYNKSLLYLVSNAFEAEPHIPLFRDGVPLLGLERSIESDSRLRDLFSGKNADWVRAPNDLKDSPFDYSTARHHGDFDDDQATVKASLARMLGKTELKGEFSFEVTKSSSRQRRANISR